MTLMSLVVCGAANHQYCAIQTFSAFPVKKRPNTEADPAAGHRIRVVPYRDFDALLDAFLTGMGARELSVRPQTVIIPSIPFSDHLQRRVADRTGICMGFDFVMPQTFISRIIRPDSKRGESDWSKRRLLWLIYPHVRAYEERVGLHDPTCRDRLALAGLLADQMDQYAHYRPDMIRAWAKGHSGLPAGATKEDRDNEKWQRELWEKLRASTDQPHPALEVERFRKDKKALAALRERYPRLVVIGTGSIDPLLVEILQLLAQAGSLIEVHVVLPSMHFLGDLRRRKELPGKDSPPDEFTPASGHDLLASMGRHAIGSFVLLGELDEQYSGWDNTPEDESGPSVALVRRLQDDIRLMREPEPDGAGLAGDKSIRVHACYGLRRETETIRDEIFRAFSELENLQPDEVHIVAPSLEPYRPLVPAVLRTAPDGAGRGLPIRLTELAPSERDPAVEGLLALLEMARVNRFETSNVLEILALPAAQASLGIGGDDRLLQRVRDWVKASGTTSGLGDAKEQGSWSNGRSRLVAGRWLGSDDSARYPDARYVLPVADDLGGEEELMEKFVAWHAHLERLMSTWQQPETPAKWQERLLEACRLLLGADDDARIEAQKYLDVLGSVECAEPLDSGAVGDWLSDESEEHARRASSWGGITFGRLKQLQHIPCRVLVVAGMQDDKFPGSHKAPAWDLLRCDPRVWDRNARVDDRQLFLDALLAATDRLVITAAVRNPRTMKERPFSSCVDELLRTLERMGAPRHDIVVKHRLQPFSPRYFREEAADEEQALPPTFNRAARVLAGEIVRPEKSAPAPFYDMPEGATEEGFSTVEIKELARFWKDPARAFLAALDVIAGDKTEREEDLDRFPLELGTLQGWEVNDAIVREIVFGANDLHRLQADLRGRRLMPPGLMAEDLDGPFFADIVELARSLVEVVGESLALRVPSCEGGLSVSGAVRVSKDGRHIVAWRPGVTKYAEHYVEPWVNAVVAACQGCTLPTLLFSEGSDPVEKSAVERGEAERILRTLMRGYSAGRSMPLGYAPRLSHEHAKILAAGNFTGGEALRKAVERAQWLKGFSAQASPGGLRPAFRLAWRDREPFADHIRWEQWTLGVAEPMRTWMNIK
jgi:exodeoxyribonuclease V gamma subunit